MLAPPARGGLGSGGWPRSGKRSRHEEVQGRVRDGTARLTVPDKPADPETAVLELNVRLPGDIFHTDPFYAGVLSPRAGYRTMKMAGSAINTTIEQTKAAISMLAPPVSGHGSRLSKTGFLTYDTRASGPPYCPWTATPRKRWPPSKTNSHRMRYAHFREDGMFLGSGTVEAGFKTFIGQRLKLSGMR